MTWTPMLPRAGARAVGLLLLASAATALSLPAAAQDVDPWEKFNRRVFAFNDWFDSRILRPVAKGYDRITPDPVQRRVGNVFDNLYTPLSATNQLLQGKPKRGLSELTRFVVNSTVGLAGIFDVAGGSGLPAQQEDFGQTFAVWSGGQGRFLVIPFRGPATTTHALGMVVNGFLSPLRLIHPVEARIAVGAVEVVDSRAGLLPSERLISGDRYLFIRDAYLQSREFEINDGEVEEDPFLDEEF
ncbi:MAG TPA: VacJ family lipoprotein [Pseudomonadales bacterium]